MDASFVHWRGRHRGNVTEDLESFNEAVSVDTSSEEQPCGAGDLVETERSDSGELKEFLDGLFRLSGRACEYFQTEWLGLQCQRRHW